MTGLLHRAAGAFVKSAALPAPPVSGARAAVLGRGSEAIAVAAALAGELRARERAPAALLAVWPGDRPLAAPAAPGARRLVARLDARGLSAVARGRLAWLALGSDAREAAGSLARAEAATDGPSVLVVCGPRCPLMDELLDERELVLLVDGPDAEPALAGLVLDDLAGRRAPVVACPPLQASLARMLALAGRGRLRDAPIRLEASS